MTGATDLAENALQAARECVRNGDKAVASGDYTAATQAYKSALTHLPNNAEILVRYADTCLQLGLGIPAERSLSVVLSTPRENIHPDVFQAAFYGLIKAYAQNGRLDRVAQMLLKNDQAIAHDRSFVDSIIVALTYTGNIGRLARYAGDIANAKPPPALAALAALGMMQAGDLKAGAATMSLAYAADVSNNDIVAMHWRSMAVLQTGGYAADVVPEAGAFQLRAQMPVYVLYQRARYFDITADLDVLEDRPEAELHQDARRPIRICSGLSRIALDVPADAQGETPPISQKTLDQSVASLRSMVAEYKAAGAFRIQLDNIAAVRRRFAPDAGDPIQVVSTGRCGTRALYYLLRKSGSVLPYHSAQFTVSPVDRNHVLYRLLAGQLDPDALVPLLRLFLETRTAEIMYAYRFGRVPIIMAHWDSIFAPLLAELFDSSRFIRLFRDDTKVFRSLFGKNQWQNAQLMPLRYEEGMPEGRFSCAEDGSLAIEQRIAWYLVLTRRFAHALAAGLPDDRFLAAKSEDLFAADPDMLIKIKKLTGIQDLDEGAYAEHFSGATNKKDELLQVDPLEIDRRAGRIPALVEELERTGRYRS